MSNWSGPVSDADLAMIISAGAALGNTTEANKLILQHMIEREQQFIEERKQFRTFTKAGNNAEDFEFLPPRTSVQDQLEAAASAGTPLVPGKTERVGNFNITVVE